MGVRAAARHVVARAVGGVAPADPLPLRAMGLGGDVRLQADDRLDSRGLGGLVELVRPEQVAVVGHRDGRHAHLGAALEQVGDPGGAVQHRVLGVDVEVDECVSAATRRTLRHDQPHLPRATPAHRPRAPGSDARATKTYTGVTAGCAGGSQQRARLIPVTDVSMSDAQRSPGLRHAVRGASAWGARVAVRARAHRGRPPSHPTQPTSHPTQPSASPPRTAKVHLAPRMPGAKSTDGVRGHERPVAEGARTRADGRPGCEDTRDRSPKVGSHDDPASVVGSAGGSAVSRLCSGSLRSFNRSTRTAGHARAASSGSSMHLSKRALLGTAALTATSASDSAPPHLPVPSWLRLRPRPRRRSRTRTAPSSTPAVSHDQRARGGIQP